MNTLKQRLASVPPVVWVLAFTLACLVPFINKAFHIDDTLFIRAAEQIQKHPADFYGFSMNWFGFPQPFPLDFENPPLTCYYIALVGSVAGWSEPALHAAFLLPALAAAWGVFSLARLYSQRPLVAALATVLTPAFLISATNVMCDIMLMALWVWSLVLFERGLENNRWRLFLGSGLLAGLAVLTKFTGLALIPLIGAYGFTRQPKLGRWAVTLCIPVLFAIAYEWVTYCLYGHGLLFAATAYSSHGRAFLGTHLLEQTVLGLGFAGGSFLTLLLYVPLLWSRRAVLVGLCLLAPVAFLLPSFGHLQPLLLHAGRLNWLTLIQNFLFVAGGLHILLLVGNDFWHRRDPVSFLLVTWVLGIFVFAIALNWTVNGRSFLPAAPALGILLARRLELRANSAAPRPAPRARALWPALAGGILSLCLVRADYHFARLNRVAAAQICAQYLKPGNSLWFEGHWGFQYYMEKYGAKPMDVSVSKLPSGDILVLPSNSTTVQDPPRDLYEAIDSFECLPSRYCAIMSTASGAGFYASSTAPLPFVAGRISSDHYWILRAK